ncbi:MAG: hypothetical protein H0T79_08860 [Deltaproteobacteria bacterium]|nr:hypothetical protein [Deltaproteobacteria bacterium]
MRLAAITLLLVACGSELPVEVIDPASTFPFGPYTIEPSQEISDQCVQITMHNEADVFVNQVELTTGPGFHHSNWFFVPENVFQGEDGPFKCDDRNYSEPAAAVFGGVLFAQSTQAPHEIQKFPDGVALKIPRRSKIIAQVHLLNSGDAPITVTPEIGLVAIPEADVTTLLAGISFENQALGLPPNMQSKFTLECDIAAQHQRILERAPDFRIYYALAHYHELGTALTVEAVRPDNTSARVFTTADRAGDVLGGPIAPLFDFTGFTKLRFSCEFYNPRSEEVTWGIGDQEMCVFLAFSDSPYNWGGGATTREPPGPRTDVDGVATFTHDCDVFGIDASR